jgi:hypothetical protein
MKLPQEYWHDHTPLEIVGAICTPLIIDTATKKKNDFLVMAIYLMKLWLSERDFLSS